LKLKNKKTHRYFYTNKYTNDALWLGARVGTGRGGGAILQRHDDQIALGHCTGEGPKLTLSIRKRVPFLVRIRRLKRPSEGMLAFSG
jgi:hypothetical protein